MPQQRTLVVQLSIELPRREDTLEALTGLLHSVAELPGVAVSHPAIPPQSTPDGSVRVVPYSRTVLSDGRSVPLTRLEFDLLLYLVRRPRRVLSRGTLMAEVWGIEEPLNSRTVDVHIRRLRDKLGPAHHGLITTVRGVGYRFDGAHRVVVEPAPEWAVV